MTCSSALADFPILKKCMIKKEKKHFTILEQEHETS